MARVAVLLAVCAAGLWAASPAIAQSPAPAIIGGVSAAAGSAPYAAFVQNTPGGGLVTYTCTGSLVAPQYVLTAGHCAFDESGAPLAASDYLISIGISDVGMVPIQTGLHVTAIHVYPTFDPDTLQGDAALLTLATPQPLTSVIPLATSANAALYAAGQPVTIMGWGVTSNDPNAGASEFLQSGTVAVQANSTCYANSGVLSFHPGFDMCVAAPGFAPSTCHGDSGGPLVAAGPIEIGIVSYGTSGTCGLGPDFFTRASSVQSWVASVIGGAPAPPSFVPPFAAPTPVLALSADGVVATFTDAPDPATLLTGFVATLYNAAGAAVASQPLPPTATSAAFPSIPPGSYTVGITASYSEGASTAGISAGVTLAPPANAVKPFIKGTGLVGSTLTCHTGAWSWPGAATFAETWLRNGAAIGVSASTYRVRAADAGKSVACRVQLKATSGPTATATSAPVRALLRLADTARPHIGGTRVVGSKLVCAPGTWAHTGTLRLGYRWLRNGRPLPGRAARAVKRTVVAGDAGHRLSCRVVAKTAGQTASATSSAVPVTAA
jgi:trypsin